MDLLAKLKSPSAGSAPAVGKPAAVSAEAAEMLRTRTRRRLIGVSMLLMIGVILFPLLFERQPRPQPAGMAIRLPAQQPVAPVRPGSLPAQRERVAAEEEPVASSASEGAGVAQVAIANPLAEPHATPAAQPRSAAASATPAATSVERDERLVIQVGAYADATEAREVRTRIEGLGLKTYVLALEGSGARRLRVRVGPFTSRAEADKAAQRLKSAGFSGSLLAL